MIGAVCCQQEILSRVHFLTAAAGSVIAFKSFRKSAEMRLDVGDLFLGERFSFFKAVQLADVVVEIFHVDTFFLFI